MNSDQELTVDEKIARVVAAAPPFTEEQLTLLSQLSRRARQDAPTRRDRMVDASPGQAA